MINGGDEPGGPRVRKAKHGLHDTTHFDAINSGIDEDESVPGSLESSVPIQTGQSQLVYHSQQC